MSDHGSLVASPEDETITDNSLAYSVDLRAELWHPDLSGPLEDVSEWLSTEGSSISYAASAAIPHTATLRWRAQLDWNAYRVALFVDLTNHETGERHTARMGVFLVDAWTQILGSDPPTYETECVSTIALLDQPIGETYRVETGTSYPQAIRDAIEAASQWNRFEPVTADPPIGPDVRVSVNDDDAYVVGSRIIPVAEARTWLDIVNHLCEGAGYRPPYADRDGLIIIDAQRTTAEAFIVDFSDPKNVAIEGARLTTDLRLHPNQWVIFGALVDPTIDAPASGDEHVPLVVHTDLQGSTGEHSFEARGRRVIRRVYAIDAAAEQADLDEGYTRSQAFTRAAARLIHDDRESTHQMQMRIAPTTRLWHNDLIRITNAANGSGYWRVVGWTLAFDGSPMPVRLVRRS